MRIMKKYSGNNEMFNNFIIQEKANGLLQILKDWSASKQKFKHFARRQVLMSPSEWTIFQRGIKQYTIDRPTNQPPVSKTRVLTWTNKKDWRWRYKIQYSFVIYGMYWTVSQPSNDRDYCGGF